MLSAERSYRAVRHHFEASIIIPVFNQWHLTRACLRALAATTKGKSVEVLIMDNASTDDTPEACPLLGKQLFGDAFRYFRSSQNINFGPASNLGAKHAQGKYLIFLNNDTIPLPGWYQPLIDDFTKFPHIAATGPLLLYPESTPFGYTVQHLGVAVTPLLRVTHLYEGIPADSPLARKRRFFQIITAACMVIPRTLFMEAGLFDEQLINGFEDVDLCLRLKQQGYQMTVNPNTRVVHYTSQTPGRHTFEKKNSIYAFNKCAKMLVPDWHEHLKYDGLALRIGTWQDIGVFCPSETCHQLDSMATAASYESLKSLLLRHPFWEKGWELLLSSCPNEREKAILQSISYRLYPDANKALEFYASAMVAGDRQRAADWLNKSKSFLVSLKKYVNKGKELRSWCDSIGFADLAGQYTDWLAHAERFSKEQLQPFLAKQKQAFAEFSAQAAPR